MNIAFGWFENRAPAQDRFSVGIVHSHYMSGINNNIIAEVYRYFGAYKWRIDTTSEAKSLYYAALFYADAPTLDSAKLYAESHLKSYGYVLRDAKLRVML